jgi:Kef-type K+ transport system membrane component KefB
LSPEPTFIPHGELLRLLVQLTVLLGFARILGETARRFGLPGVVGELLAGVMLGPSVAGVLLPGVAGLWIPESPTQGRLLEVVASLGAITLLVVTGLETDLGLIRRRANVALGVAAGGLLVPFVLGMALGWWFPGDLLGDPGERLVFALFLATAMAVSAIPVLATILLELGMMRRDVGQTMLAAGMIDDLAGWTLLGVVVSLSGDGGGLRSVSSTIAAVAAFILATWLLARPLAAVSVRLVHSVPGPSHRFLSLAVVLVMGWAAVSHAMHLEPVIGAFVMGILLGRLRRVPAHTFETLEDVTFGIFAPIFFATAGLKVDITTLTQPRLALLTAAVISVAVIGKLTGVYLGARWLAGSPPAHALAYGIGLTARGAIGIVVATVGLSLGILTVEVFSMVVAMAVATSLVTPPALKAVLSRILPDPEEATRLRRESALTGGALPPTQRVLVAVRPGGEVDETTEVKVELLSKLARTQIAVTVLSVADPENRATAEAVGRRIAAHLEGDVSIRVVAGDPVRVVLAEAEKGYDLVILGAPETTGDRPLGPVLEEMVRMLPVPSLIIRALPHSDWRGRRILVPTDGSLPARRAFELALRLASEQTQVFALHVVPPEVSPAVSVSDTGPTRRLELAHQVLTEARERGSALGLRVETLVEVGDPPEDLILSTAARLGADLIVVGTSARAGTTRLYLGSRVETLLREAPVTVAVLNS